MALALEFLKKEDIEAVEMLKEMYFDKLKEMALIMKYVHMVNIHQRIKDYNKDKYPQLSFSPPFMMTILNSGHWHQKDSLNRVGNLALVGPV